MTDYFVGRQNEIDAFKRCLTSRSQNGIYYYGGGGIGKSKLLRKIVSLCQVEGYQAALIDFFSTQNRSIDGLQNSIIEQFSNTQAFQEVFESRKKLEEIRTSYHELSYQKELISSLQKQTEIVFAHCCNKAAKDKRVILAFDSFEYVQKRDIGRWFLNEFLPHLKADKVYGIVVVLAGRPEPSYAKTPVNIIQYPLSGLSQEEIKIYIQNIWMPWLEDFGALYQGSQGNPLIIELLRWRGRRDLMTASGNC